MTADSESCESPSSSVAYPNDFSGPRAEQISRLVRHRWMRDALSHCKFIPQPNSCSTASISSFGDQRAAYQFRERTTISAFRLCVQSYVAWNLAMAACCHILGCTLIVSDRMKYARFGCHWKQSFDGQPISTGGKHPVGWCEGNGAFEAKLELSFVDTRCGLFLTNQSSNRIDGSMFYRDCMEAG
jgi:hypothetical protein